ncbi:HIRAN domain-containing protein [Arthrobacter sp. MMS18-M83]|uniref:HIRAN domain-containing protein n=1 Tax=Arthrobacter sp. MMS18-M83 TaxID=2996261 RepID=UPI00227A6FCC|nr:HIRAN domain-containing protein [Arthrobacter sp. MMS18-M83]WAH97519.1 hypothetical protein OW521_01045 [Arthrobacter sp. MMS18-M83]
MEHHGTYTFRYFPGVENNPNFRPIPGFRDVSRTYESTVLFPFFSGRIMSHRRPDRVEWLQKLGLPADAAPFEILARSFGKRVADTYEMFAEPEVDLAEDSLRFLVPVHGLKYQSAAAQELVDSGRLKEGAGLRVVAEPDNVADPRAQAIQTETGERIGYVPAPVLDYVKLLNQSGLFDAVVAAVNPSSDGLHLRVLMWLEWRTLQLDPQNSAQLPV